MRVRQPALSFQPVPAPGEPGALGNGSLRGQTDRHFGGLHLAGHGPLPHLQAPEGLAMNLGDCNLFSIRHCGKGFHAHIGSLDAVPRAMAIIACIWHIHLNGEKPLIRLAGDAGSPNFTGKPKGFLHGHPPDFGQFDLRPLQAKFVIRDIKAIPRFSPFFLKTGRLF